MALSALSSTLMYFMDRVFLSHYSVEAMNGAAYAHQIVDLFFLPLMAFATMSEVFVGQYNGARAFSKAATPVFQIILFTVSIWAVLFPISLCYCDRWIPPSLLSEGGPYFVIGMILLPIYIIFAACSAFFVGTRRPRLILMGVLVGSLINGVLDWIFIFGKGPFPAMGAQGAALASLCASFVTSGILLAFFLNRHNSKNYQTRRLHMDLSMLKKNISLGFPFALSELIEMGIWVLCLYFLEKVSKDAVTIQNVSIALWVFFTFALEGFQKGVMALASNCLGAQKEQFIPRLIRSMSLISVFFALFTTGPLLFFPESTLYYAFGITDASLYVEFKKVFMLMWCEMNILLMMYSCFAGILNSGGDTKFVMMSKVFSIFLFFGLPLIFIIHAGRLNSQTCWILTLCQAIFNGFLVHGRYRSGKWKHNLMR
ncbi:MATE family efflux transporter [Alphaproteobacteria bacterium]|nr:MATE family efflux transporter [Alphaproteobacteria bacterium]